MPYYFNSTIQGWARTCFEDPITEEELRNSDIVYFVDDMLDWMNTRYGEEGDCECERNPKSNKKSYETFPPKPTDKTKIGKWLRNYMDFADIHENQMIDNIFDTIYNNISMANIEKLFHSLDTDDQLEFKDYVSSDDRFSENSEIDDTIEPYDSCDSDDFENEISEADNSDLSDNFENEISEADDDYENDYYTDTTQEIYSYNINPISIHV